MLILPKNLGLLAGCAGEQSRHALHAVRVIACQDAWYRCEATDGHILAILCGPSNCPTKEQESIAAQLDGAGGGSFEGLIPASEWKRWFQGVPKNGHLGIVLAPHEAILATVDMKGRTQLMDGRFPEVDRVLPRTLPLVRFVVNPALLRDLLVLAEAVCKVSDATPRVEFLFYQPGGPIGLMARNDQGQTLDALIMPLTDPAK